MIIYTNDNKLVQVNQENKLVLMQNDTNIAEDKNTNNLRNLNKIGLLTNELIRLYDKLNNDLDIGNELLGENTIKEIKDLMKKSIENSILDKTKTLKELTNEL